MATSDKPKLFYFDVAGRGEVTRLIFVYTGNEFEDVRFTREEWGSKYKSGAPFEMAPYYEEGGVKLGGGLAIARYVGEKYGLGGKTPFENAQLESYGDALMDLGSKIYDITMGPEDKRGESKVEFFKTAPGKFEFLEKQIKGKDSFFDGRLTWADLMSFTVTNGLTCAGLAEPFKDCPKFKAIHAKFAADEKIKAHYAKHPPSEP